MEVRTLWFLCLCLLLLFFNNKREREKEEDMVKSRADNLTCEFNTSMISSFTRIYREKYCSPLPPAKLVVIFNSVIKISIFSIDLPKVSIQAL